MTTDLIGTAGRAAGVKRREARLLAVGAGVLAALAVWVVAEAAFDLDLRQPAFGDAQETKGMPAALVAAASALGAAAGWALLAVLEHLTVRARAIWTGVASVVLVASLSQPLSGHGVNAGVKLTLVLMHLVVGVVVIALLRRSAPGRPTLMGTP
jgi:Family of unknown function (DUF6069)